MSFQEKSIWITLIIILLMFGPYFIFAFSTFWEAFSGTSVDSYRLPFLTIPLFIGAVILLTIIMAISHIVLAFAFSKDAQAGGDERDNLIELKATRISYFILAFGVWVTGLSSLFLPLTNIFLAHLVMAHIIMFFFFLAEISGWSLQLFHYRRGI